MIRWLKPPHARTLRSSLYGLLGNPGPSESMLDNAEDDIRDSMLSLLGPSGTKQFSQLVRRIRYADGLQSLWYLRGDLLAAVAASCGEMSASRKVACITAQFQGLLPGGLSSRPSPLA